jgi:NDP-sugar pyrophosphorylase family protein
MDIRLKAIVLAAGKGNRLSSDDNDLPKMMRLAAGKPLLEHVLGAISFIAKENTIIVVGYKKEEITEHFQGYIYAVQNQQLGTGHAVMSTMNELSGYNGAVLVCKGDMPAVRDSTYRALVKEHFDRGNDCTILTGESATPLAYGRIERDENGDFKQIVEERDCTAEQLAIKEINSGIYIFRAPMMLFALGQLTNNNSQGEYYLTDVPAIMKGLGATIGTFKRDLSEEIIGVNTADELAHVDEILTQRPHKDREETLRRDSAYTEFQNRRRKSDWLVNTAAIMSILAWVVTFAVWIVLSQAAPHRQTVFFFVYSVYDRREYWDSPLLYVAFALLLASLAICTAAFFFNKLRMRRKTDKYRKSVFIIGGVTLLGLIYFLINFGSVIFS